LTELEELKALNAKMDIILKIAINQFVSLDDPEYAKIVSHIEPTPTKEKV
jgi:hypothetical protein